MAGFADESLFRLGLQAVFAAAKRALRERPINGAFTLIGDQFCPGLARRQAEEQ
jgi:hypothetical protein